MKLFGNSGPAPLVFGVAMLALVGKETVTSEEAVAANEELTKAGIKGASLITEAYFNKISGKAGRVDAAEASVKATTDALAAAGVESIAALVAQRDGFKVKADKFDKQAGASHTNPVLPAGASDVEEAAPDAHQETINNLAHNKALESHPLFGAKPKAS